MPPDAPVLEITLLGPTLHCHGRWRRALTGADLGASLSGQPWPPGETRTLREGDQLSFGRRRSGARAYLAVADGFRLKQVLGSRTTNLRAGFGGRHVCRLEKVPVSENAAKLWEYPSRNQPMTAIDPKQPLP
ncbi:hypothetical protein thsps117_35590 [Pseudomonas sp. No.117]